MAQTFRIAAIALAAAATSFGVAAQDFPGRKNITVVVPFTAGGPTDRLRYFAPRPGASVEARVARRW